MNNKNVDLKQKYKELKSILRSLIYENETYQEQLRQSQKQFLQLTNDRNFLLDRLLAYESVIESDCSDCSELESDINGELSTNEKPPITKRTNSANSMPKKKRQNCDTQLKKCESIQVKITKKVRVPNENKSTGNESNSANRNKTASASTKATDKKSNLNSVQTTANSQISKLDNSIVPSSTIAVKNDTKLNNSINFDDRYLIDTKEVINSLQNDALQVNEIHFEPHDFSQDKLSFNDLNNVLPDLSL